MKKIQVIILLLSALISNLAAQNTAPVANAFTEKDNALSILNSSGPFGELPLYNTQGDPVAYIDCKDNYTIYFWDGNAVAYLYQNENLFSIYNFNGNHLGWFVNGIIIDHGGSMVGTSKDALSSVIYQLEPNNKEFKKMKPIKKMRGPEPYIPLMTSFWSDISLGIFLAPVNLK
jgi:hypothetical protein